MYRVKNWLSVLVALVFLSFTFTSALAGSQPPGNMPPPSDFAPSDPSTFTPQPAQPVPAGGIGVDAVHPAPIAPLNNNVYTLTPKFYFTPKTGASQYHLVVVDTTATPDKLIYNFYGTGSCTSKLCTMQPSNTLKSFRYLANTGGTYYWAVEAMVGGAWKGLSSNAYFSVLSSGFTSTFDTDTSKWQQIYGSWARNTSGYYKTLGVTGNVASAMQKEFFINDYVYEVTMKRKVEDSYNFIHFMGEPEPLSTQNAWSKSYMFGYYNTGVWALWRHDASGTYTEIASAASQFITPYDWNTVTVWTDYPAIHLWINGAYLGHYEDDTYMSGYVGVGMYENDAAKSALLVDSAKLVYSAISPYAITDVEPAEPQNLQFNGSGK